MLYMLNCGKTPGQGGEENKRAREPTPPSHPCSGCPPRASASRYRIPRSCETCGGGRRDQSSDSPIQVQDGGQPEPTASFSRQTGRGRADSQLVSGGLGEVDGGLSAHAGAAVKDHRLLLCRLVEAVQARKVACRDAVAVRRGQARNARRGGKD